MTTNQTIDGVPRRVCHACVGLPRKAYCPVCDDDPAAQGEPVAWMNFDGEGGYDFTEDKETADRWKVSNGTYADWLTPLYAAQPAPVAVR